MPRGWRWRGRGRKSAQYAAGPSGRKERAKEAANAGAAIYAAKPGYSSGADDRTALWRGASTGSPDRLSFPSSYAGGTRRHTDRRSAHGRRNPQARATAVASCEAAPTSVPFPAPTPRSLMPKRGERVAPPARRGEWELRFGESEAAAGCASGTIYKGNRAHCGAQDRGARRTVA